MEKTVEIKKEDQKTVEEIMNDGTQCLNQEEIDELVEKYKREHPKKS